MDYGTVLIWIGMSFLAIAIGGGLLYGNISKSRAAHPRQAGARQHDMRREGQRLSPD